jgi:hypothetical protein
MERFHQRNKDDDFFAKKDDLSNIKNKQDK